MLSVRWLLPVACCSTGDEKEEERAGAPAASLSPPPLPLHSVLALLPVSDQQAVLRYRQPLDRARAAIGRAVCRAFLQYATGLQADRVPVIRTAMGKPQLDVAAAAAALTAAGSCCPAAAGSCCLRRLSRIAFNLSHHGDWLLFVAEWSCACAEPDASDGGRADETRGLPLPPLPPLPALLGCDITRAELPRSIAAAYAEAFAQHTAAESGQQQEKLQTAASRCSLQSAMSFGTAGSPLRLCASLLSEYLAAFRPLLTGEEWRSITRRRLPCPASLPAADCDCLQEFCLLWSAKEAVVKALGCGLSMPLSRLQLTRPEEAAGEAAEQQPRLKLAWLLRPPQSEEQQPPVPCRRLPSVSPPTGCCCVCLQPLSRCLCSCPCPSCCSLLQWELDCAAVDSTHFAAVARAEQQAWQPGEPPQHSADCTQQSGSLLCSLGSALPHAAQLRLVSLQQLLDQVRWTRGASA